MRSPIDEVRARAAGHCEAMVMVDFRRWARCGKGPIEVHHLLTRARGGVILDSIGETYHLMGLCPEHHAGADGEEAYAGDLLIDGYVIRENGQIKYFGTDEYLRKEYPSDRYGESAQLG